MTTARKPVALIIDDDDFYRTTLTGIFREDGYSCTSAENGGTGFSLYKKIIPDLVILDRIMPEKGGTRFLMSVNDNPNRSEAVLVVYSSTLKETHIRNGKSSTLQAGFSKILEIPKSISPEELSVLVKNLIISNKE